ncbi:Purine-binding protein [Methylobacterium cerastii]|uniref:Purine-binding protein n=1 Tax=Methylobacterium cerastii TaxID=932741 RepID=A0ABQ4QLH5_9HYPH|nr:MULTISPECIES: BMP family ABC transporter substrate-binding protein [Methylobacterium]TXM71562.1 BMP family ABC transporter substrate-binding protein [Methylobacterium sp. WL12]TXM95799.1 BMP family ABC transporter substrate-binding protein [Methylobacterium sp. WL122]TXN80598.1 BMP family ABC transporter substrate-binding protein [Methylobacterium sp. WL8]GJD45670.1 Purine-binding protein [Methylobacterium cerastii]
MADHAADHSLSRRHLLGGAAALALAPLSRARAAGTLTAGFIYVGPKDDYGYNQAHALAAKALKGMPGLEVTEEERVPETNAVEKTMESMIALDGASLLLPTSFGYYSPYMVAEAKKNPKIQFRHCGGLWTDKDPKNAGSYFGYIAQGQYLNGIVAGHATKSKKVGFVAAKPIPQVLNNINAFLLGAQSVDPSITCQVIFTGEWSLAVKEAEATNALIDGGADVITCHVDSPKVTVETAARRGAFVCGYHVDQSPLAPQKYLTGAEWNWLPIYKGFVEAMQAGKVPENFVRGGLADGYVKMSPYGPGVSDAARKNADAVKAEMMKGGYQIIKGPLKDNAGKEILAAGQGYPEKAPELESTNYLVAGVKGSV